MAASPDAKPGLARRIGAFDATMIVMGGIVGSGIFANPREVAVELPSAPLLLAAWGAGGVMALLGALIYAELAARRPGVGGQYAYLRDAYHPLAAFLYGWVLLLVVQTGGMAAVALIFARYSGRLLGVSFPEPALGMAALLALTVVNCLGVAMGARVQSALMVLKIAAIATLIVCGWLLVPPVTGSAVAAPLAGQGVRALFAFGAAMAPVLFAYGGWQTAGFVSGELRDPRRDLPRGLLLGVSGVIVLYLGVNWVCVRALGGPGLARTLAPASAVMERALGPGGRGSSRRASPSRRWVSSASRCSPRRACTTRWRTTACSSSASAASIPARGCPCSRSPCRARSRCCSRPGDSTARSSTT